MGEITFGDEIPCGDEIAAAMSGFNFIRCAASDFIIHKVDDFIVSFASDFITKNLRSFFQLNPPCRVGEITFGDEIPYGDEIAAAMGGFNFIRCAVSDFIIHKVDDFIVSFASDFITKNLRSFFS